MSTLFDLTDKVALITGASSGMGRAIAQALGEQGAVVLVSSNDAEGCQQTVADFKKRNIQAQAFPCDVSVKQDIDNLAAKIQYEIGTVDILVSCVGIAPTGPFANIHEEQFWQTMHLNLQSAMHLTQQLLPGMVKQKDGVVIYLASIAAVRGNKHIGLYGMSKAALVQMARNLAVEYGPHNLRINSISPGLIDTPFSKPLLAQEAFMQKRLALTPLRRVGTPEEIAGLAVLLASRTGAFITGQNIVVDGGTTISDGN